LNNKCQESTYQVIEPPDKENQMKKSRAPGKAKLLEAVKQALMLEINGFQFYQVAAERCSNPVARQMFEELARDETQHRAELERQFRSILQENRWRPPPRSKKPDLRFKDPVIDQSLKKNIEGAWFDFAALQIGVMLEKRTLDHYRNQRSCTEDPELKALYTWLTEWEEGHLDRLMTLERAMREEIWNEAGFWPLD
jgi:rubrerythrin